MAHRFATAALALGAVLAVAPTSWAGPKGEDQKSAREDDAAPKKFEAKQAEPKKAGPREGGELAERLSTLERQVRELTNFVKQRLSGEGKFADHGQPAHKGQPDKAAMAKGEAKPGGDKKQFDKGQHPDKFAAAKADVKRDGGGPQLVKGKDGQLLVPLSALPPGMQKEILARSHREHGEGKGGVDKFQAQPKKGQDDDDDDKSKGKKPEREHERREK